MSAVDRDPVYDLESSLPGSGRSGSYIDNEQGSSSTDTGYGAVEQEEEKMQLANRETVIVVRLRLLVFLVLLLASISVSAVVYYTANDAEETEAETQYDSAAERVIEAFIDIVDSKLATVSSLGVAAIAHGVDHTNAWPFVTLSRFQQRAATAREESGALYVHINPMVSESDRQEWEEFVVGEDSDWM
jgi:hypothetical protein